MHTLEIIQKRNEQQVLREFADAVVRRDYETWKSIFKANPDLQFVFRTILDSERYQ